MEGETIVVLDELDLTTNLTIQRIALINSGHKLTKNKKLPKGHYSIGIRVISDYRIFSSIEDIDCGNVITMLKDLKAFKKRGRKYEN